MIHTPEDFPDISSSYKLFSELNQSSRISVSVSYIRADESLRWLNEKDRKCFLYKRRSARDANLPSYRSNAVDNCYSKCRLETTYKMCNCTPYFFETRGNKFKNIKIYVLLVTVKKKKFQWHNYYTAYSTICAVYSFYFTFFLNIISQIRLVV